MRGMLRYRIVAVVALVTVAMIAPEASAQANGISQYLGGKAARSSPAFAVYNPTGKEMFALAIAYNRDEEFQTCIGAVVTRNGAFVYEDSFSGDSKGFLQVISVPTAGSLLFDPTPGLIGEARGKGHQLVPINPSLWTRPHSADLADFTSCVCNELNNFGLKPKILLPFLPGLTCPSV